MGPNSVTERASDDRRLGSLEDTILIAKLSRVINNQIEVLTPNNSVESFSCFHELQCTGNR